MGKLSPLQKEVESFQCLEFVKEDVKNALKDYSKEEEPNCFAQAYFQRMDSNEHLEWGFFIFMYLTVYFSMDNLYNVCADFFMAGMETTSTALRWAMLYLAGEQDVQVDCVLFLFIIPCSSGETKKRAGLCRWFHSAAFPS